ncbi:MAG: endonuclease/exonuclease/phosphatase family protein [Dehalococcoidia bacterium]|nr:endonuclease/exonuclease/phosphatase family protein [Dehalococcoidia bacterium]
MTEFTVVSLNLRGIHDSWLRREPLVVHGLAEIHPDIICLQEAATWCLQARWLGWRLSRATGYRYHAVQARKRGWRGILEGVAILSRHPLVEHRALGLGAEGRVALRAGVRVEGCPLVVGNAHLDHHSSSGDARQRQAQALVRWLENARVPALLAGDLNDVPGSPALQTFAGPFRSAHEGVELVGTAPAWDRHRVIDYILVGEGVEVIEAATCLDAPIAGRWPSDHIGLWARLRTSPQEA